MKKDDIASRDAGSLTSVWCKDKRYFVYIFYHTHICFLRKGGGGTSGKNQRLLSGSRLYSTTTLTSHLLINMAEWSAAIM